MRDYEMTAGQQDEMWERWRQGQSLTRISRDLVVPLHHIRRFLAQSGGVRQPARTRAVRHLSAGEREEISRGLAAGLSLRAIAAGLGRPASTVSREVSRNGGREIYRAAVADASAWLRARRPKPALLARVERLRVVVEAKLELFWSPQQIAGWLKTAYPEDPVMRVSHETIYLSLYVRSRAALREGLARGLRRGRVMRYPRTARQPSGRGRIVGMVPISARPAEVADRAVAGHWEGDLVLGRRPSAVATLVERTSRYTLLVALPEGFSAPAVRAALTAMVLTVPAVVRRSLTWDQGKEMADHATLTAATGLAVTSATGVVPGSAAVTRTL